MHANNGRSIDIDAGFVKIISCLIIQCYITVQVIVLIMLLKENIKPKQLKQTETGRSVP